MKLKKLLIENEETTRLSFTAPMSLADRIERYRDYIVDNGLPKIKRQDLLEKIITQFLMDDKDFKRWEKAQENGGESSPDASQKQKRKADSKKTSTKSETTKTDPETEDVPSATSAAESKKPEQDVNPSSGQETPDKADEHEAAPADNGAPPVSGEEDDEPFNADALINQTAKPGPVSHDEEKGDASNSNRASVEVM